MTWSRIQGYPDPGDGLRLHLNENTGGCSPRVLEAIRRVRRRPTCRPIRRTASPCSRCARHFDVDPGLGAADQRPRRRDPDGGRRPHRTRPHPRRGNDRPAAGVRSVSELDGGGRRHGGARAAGPAITRFQTEAVLAAITPRTRMIFLNTPNNPTGQLIAIDGSAAASPRRRRDAVVLIDEAYIEFGGDDVPARARAVPERPRRPHVLEGVRPRRHARRDRHRPAAGARSRCAR